MSVYRPKNKSGEFTSPFFHYDFQCRGHRFHGTTACTDQREAKRFEKAKRKEVEALIEKEGFLDGKPMTVHDACAQYWLEVGQHLASANDTWTYLARIEKMLGPTTLLSAITTAKVADKVARRRGENVAAATVNRTLTEPLRRIMRRAERVWEQRVRPINWRELILPEPLERVREANDEEEAALVSGIRDDYRPALEFMFLSGCRLEEVVTLTWDRVQWTAGAVEIRGKSRRGGEEKVRHIPITPDIHDILWSIKDHHPVAVFTYEAQRPQKERGIARGDRVPLTYEGLKTRWQRDRAAAGITDFRLHDTRHTALTRLVRETGNLKIAQKLAGHTDISTTAKYAHANVDDIRDAMERVSKSRKNPRTAGRKVS